MNKIIAKSGNQLANYLKWLYNENTAFEVKVVQADKGKIVYEINVAADEQKFNKLSEQIRTIFH